MVCVSAHVRLEGTLWCCRSFGSNPPASLLMEAEGSTMGRRSGGGVSTSSLSACKSRYRWLTACRPQLLNVPSFQPAVVDSTHLPTGPRQPCTQSKAWQGSYSGPGGCERCCLAGSRGVSAALGPAAARRRRPPPAAGRTIWGTAAWLHPCTPRTSHCHAACAP